MTDDGEKTLEDKLFGRPHDEERGFFEVNGKRFLLVRHGHLEAFYTEDGNSGWFGGPKNDFIKVLELQDLPPLALGMNFGPGQGEREFVFCSVDSRGFFGGPFNNIGTLSGGYGQCLIDAEEGYLVIGQKEIDSTHALYGPYGRKSDSFGGEWDAFVSLLDSGEETLVEVFSQNYPLHSLPDPSGILGPRTGERHLVVSEDGRRHWFGGPQKKNFEFQVLGRALYALRENGFCNADGFLYTEEEAERESLERMMAFTSEKNQVYNRLKDFLRLKDQPNASPDNRVHMIPVGNVYEAARRKLLEKWPQLFTLRDKLTGWVVNYLRDTRTFNLWLDVLEYQEDKSRLETSIRTMEYVGLWDEHAMTRFEKALKYNVELPRKERNSLADLVDCSRCDSDIGDFLKKLGSGVAGSTYLLYHREFDKQMAVKIIDREKYNPEEAKKLANLPYHPNIVEVRHSGKFVKYRGKPTNAILMDYVDGKTLREVIDENPEGLQSDELIYLAGQLFGAIEHMYKNDMFHRDIHPNNVKVGSFGELKVFDFGIATNVGTEPKDNYRYGGNSDLFSWGLVTYELATGRHLVAEKEEDMGSATHRELVRSQMCELRQEDGSLNPAYRKKIKKNSPRHLVKPLQLALENTKKNHEGSRMRWISDFLSPTRKVKLFRGKLTLAGLALAGTLGVGLSFVVSLGPDVKEAKSLIKYNFVHQPLLEYSKLLGHSLPQTEPLDEENAPDFETQFRFSNTLVGGSRTWVASRAQAPTDERSFYNITVIDEGESPRAAKLFSSPSAAVEWDWNSGGSEEILLKAKTANGFLYGLTINMSEPPEMETGFVATPRAEHIQPILQDYAIEAQQMTRLLENQWRVSNPRGFVLRRISTSREANYLEGLHLAYAYPQKEVNILPGEKMSFHARADLITMSRNHSSDLYKYDYTVHRDGRWNFTDRHWTIKKTNKDSWPPAVKQIKVGQQGLIDFPDVGTYEVHLHVLKGGHAADHRWQVNVVEPPTSAFPILALPKVNPFPTGHAFSDYVNYFGPDNDEQGVFHHMFEFLVSWYDSEKGPGEVGIDILINNHKFSSHMAQYSGEASLPRPTIVAIPRELIKEGDLLTARIVSNTANQAIGQEVSQIYHP